MTLGANSGFADDSTVDPGWASAVRGAALVLIPGFGVLVQRRRARQGRIDGLTMLRSVFASFTVAHGLIILVVDVLVNASDLASRPHRLASGPIAAGIVTLGVVTLLTSAKVARALPTTNAAELAGAYRTRFFLKTAFAQAPSLVGFVGFILTGRWWAYPLGSAFTVVGFARLAPTAAHLDRDQEAIRTSGSSLNLIAALRTAMPPPAGRRRPSPQTRPRSERGRKTSDPAVSAPIARSIDTPG